MKTLALALFTLFNVVLNAQKFQQDFSASSLPGDYISATPGNSFFNSISSSGAGVTVSIQSNKLRFVRAGANTGSFTRNTDMSGPPVSLIFQFDLAVSGTTTPVTSAALFYVGNNFSTTNTTEANADVFARFSVNTTSTDGSFQLRDITSGINSATLTGPTRIWWVMNKSGATKEYKAPDGTIATIATGKADLWGGTNILFNDVSVQTPAQTIADIKFLNNQGSQTIDIDNMLIDPIPASPLAYAPTSVSSNSFTANWEAISGATGYRLDVSKRSNFSTFVAGYEGLNISGGSTTSAPVSGLLWGNTYYYRVRTSADYTVASYESGHSNVFNVVTGILPVVFTDISLNKINDEVKVTFSVTSESGIASYHLEKSVDGEKFYATGKETMAENDGLAHAYSMYDVLRQSPSAFYRVSAHSFNGLIQYSNIVMVRPSAGKEGRLGLKSNPVCGDQLSFSSENIPEGNYVIMIVSSCGELLMRRELVFRKGMMTTIPLHRFQSGTYILLVKGVVQLTELFVIGR